MHATRILKANHTIVIRASFSVKNVVLNTCNSELHGVIYASTLSAMLAAHSENEMFVCISPYREQDVAPWRVSLYRGLPNG
jgi:hypothetical protein